MKHHRRFKTLGPKHYEESPELFYDDFEIGAVIEHRPGRTVMETDNLLVNMLSMNPHPLHINQHYAASTTFQTIVVSSLVTFNIINGLSVSSTSLSAIANLGWEQVSLHHPVIVGDTLYASTEILTKRRSRSRPDTGIVKVQTTGTKATGEVVVTFHRQFLVPTSDRAAYGHAPA